MQKTNPAVFDRIIIGGWLAMLALGQLGLHVAYPPLECAAVAWAVVGVWLVRRGTCVPLLILICPAFMSEIHRPWAWAQGLIVFSLIARMVTENYFSRKQWGVTAAGVAATVVLSWPADAAALWREYRSFPTTDMIRQFLGPEAVWAAFPFRETMDRALIVLLVILLVQGGRYLVRHRVWMALAGCALATLVATYGAVIFPWQEPHRFLGTTNYGAYYTWTFHGPGYNVSYFALFLVVGLLWFFVPIHGPHRWVHPGYAPLLVPVGLMHQRAFYLALLCGFVLLGSVFAGIRKKGASWRQRRRTYLLSPLPVLTFMGSLVLMLLWFEGVGIRDVKSQLSRQLSRKPFLEDIRPASRQQPAVTRQRELRRARRAEPENTPRRKSTAARTDAKPTEALAPGASIFSRLMQRVQRIDPVRSHMWTLGLNTVRERYLWRGAGAGTWARFHRDQPRPFRAYQAHMHNTYMDLMFEYGLVPLLLGLVLWGATLLRVAWGRDGTNRLWLFYLVPVSVMALGQHLFFAFTNLCFLVPAFILVGNTLRAGLGFMHRATPFTGRAGHSPKVRDNPVRAMR